MHVLPGRGSCRCSRGRPGPSGQSAHDAEAAPAEPLAVVALRAFAVARPDIPAVLRGNEPVLLATEPPAPLKLEPRLPWPRAEHLGPTPEDLDVVVVGLANRLPDEERQRHRLDLRALRGEEEFGAGGHCACGAHG